MLCPGTLIVRSATLGVCPVLKWVPDDPTYNEASQTIRRDSGNHSGGHSSNRLSEGTKFGSLNDREWTVVSDGAEGNNPDRSVMLTVNSGEGENKLEKAIKGKIIVRPIHVELTELKSFQLCDDGNQLVLIQKDGTKYNPLIFLDEGPEKLIEVLRR